MRRTFLIAGVSAGLLLGTPAAFATTSPTATPGATATPAPSAPKLTVAPGHGVPGGSVRITVDCDGGSYLSSKAVDIVKDGFFPTADPDVSVLAYAGKVRKVPAGRYTVNLRCHRLDGRPDTHASVPFVVDRAAVKPPVADKKQVAKVPAGAPQTGGTDGPADDSGTPLAAAAAMGVLAVGGSGLVMARRARRR